MQHKRFLLISLLSISVLVNAQNQPKVGLCLSGGGAKGLAHIGLLKLIDSLGIKVDYITGTSMGSIIGGLYASGYTGKQIDSIAHSADWDMLLNQYVPMNQICMDEKDEYKKYIGELPISKGHIQVTGIIEGQELLTFLTRLTRHVNHIRDFKDLPIPFRCIGVDIVNIQPVILDHGSLAIAMRASMAIPTVFKPVKVEGKLLVDGGVMVTFPVRQLKEMGAEFIIGSYTGARLLDEQEMNTIEKLLLQSSMFYSINECKDDIKLCNIFNNLTENMKGFTTGDFIKANKIISIGDKVSRSVLPQLKELALIQKSRGVDLNKEQKKSQPKKIKVESIVFDTLKNKHLEQFVFKRLTFKQGDSITYKDLDKSIKNIYGSRNFFRSFYSLEKQETGDYKVIINLEEDNKFRIKGAMHYDNELGAGIILNLTARNIFGKPSRLVASVDLAEAPKYKLNYKKYLRSSRTSLYAQLFNEITSLKLYDTSNGKINSISKTNYNSINIGYNKDININSSFNFGLSIEGYNVIPKYNNKSVSFNVQEFDYNIASISVGLKGVFQYNTLNTNIFPKSGTDFIIENKLVLIPFESQKFTRITPYLVIHKQDNITPTGTVSVSDTTLRLDTTITNNQVFFSPYNRLFIKFNHYTPISRKTSLITNFNTGLIFYKLINLDTANLVGYQYSKENPTIDNFYIGGAEQRSRATSFIPFWGAKEGEFMVTNYVIAQLGLQWEAYPKLYITPSFSYCFETSSVNNFIKDIINADPAEGKRYNPSPKHSYMALYSSGINIGYKSFFGPINFNISKISKYNYYRIYFSVGYRF
ncbi:MAG: patatin-like phospholipase family protein [Bacteroidales bacterium]|nr:patatin-like phospholipase family protein [Bacteroidales bacterium]